MFEISETKREINFIFYRFRHILIYILIGLFSILVELFLRKQFLNVGFSSILSIITSIFFGILIAFFLNIKFNFFIPQHLLLRSLLYFIIISIISVSIQFLISFFVGGNFSNKDNYGILRLIISGFVFLFAYIFHKKISFKENAKVGVAIYAKRNENTHGIFQKIGVYPDFIHVDIVDKTFVDNDVDPNFYQFELIKKLWKKHEIHAHVMSKKPSTWIKQIANYADIIFIHYEIDENIDDIKKLITDNGCRPGIVLHGIQNYVDELKQISKSFKEIMVLCIKTAGHSGQKFFEGSYDLIEQLNKLKNRKSFNLHVDGGINKENIKTIKAQYIVSGSGVLNSLNPKNEILVLKTFGKYSNYEKK